MASSRRRILFCLFFISGFCGLVYQVIWTRLAFAAFGIITPVLSVVISVFMLGLSLGSWLGGRRIGSWTKTTGFSAMHFYAGAELLVGVGAFVVPLLFAGGEKLLLTVGQSNSIAYLLLSALVLTMSLLPWCVLMGSTFPLVMQYVREEADGDTHSFSFLYLANVLGAMAGALLSAAVLVEVFGFHQTLRITATGNFAIAGVAMLLARSRRKAKRGAPAAAADFPGHMEPRAGAPLISGRMIRWMLFATGFSAMAMEVVWSRQFTPVLKTQVYSFAMIVFTYLGATFLGSLVYRRHLRGSTPTQPTVLMVFLVLAGLFPVVLCDPRLVSMDPLSDLRPGGAVVVLLGIVPICAVLGYLTPGLVDQYSMGDPDRAGSAYAINVLGCILGPLFACYGLLPWINEKWAILLLCLPFLLFAIHGRNSLAPRWRAGSAFAVVSMSVYALGLATDFPNWVARQSSRSEIRRDYAASVISADWETKRLFVNGIGMTVLTPITKFMVHLPLALQPVPPRSALVICFGMGTTYRSALSWDIDTTAVELVPSVTQAFGFYHEDAAAVLANPRGRIVIDDGRRFLARTRQTFDVIVVDPPPPVEAAGSSLLYSTKFYALARQHLNPHGILQAWFPGGEKVIAQAVLRSVCTSFPYVRCFPSIQGWGVHILASMNPIIVPTPAQLAERMPKRARQDLLEWAPSPDAGGYLGLVITNEYSIPESLDPNPRIQITDDAPLNEYFLLRRAGLF